MQYCPGFETNRGYCDNVEVLAETYNALYHYQVTCPGNHDLVHVNPTDRRSYFRHKNIADCNMMSQWHKDWQAKFPVHMQEVSFAKLDNMVKARRADIHISKHNTIIEFQHSYIEPAEVINRVNDYAKYGKHVIWVVDGGVDIKVTNLSEHNRRFLHFTSNMWKYDSFVTCAVIYIHINQYVYKVYPNAVKSYMIDVDSPLTVDEFINYIYNNDPILTKVTLPPQCTLYITQQGAGNGKTYGIVQKLISKEFAHYDYFIMVTKMHSAKHIMYQELLKQFADGKLKDLDKTSTRDQEESNKKYIVRFTNSNSDSNTEKAAVFSTIDSLMYTLGDRTASGIDKFAAIVESIIRDTQLSIQHSIQYSQKGLSAINIPLNKRMCLICDEIQDLRRDYAEAIIKIMRDKYVDAYIVGDKLQSIQFGDNAFVYLTEKSFPNIIKITPPKTNVCRRFTNPAFVDFVNDMIDFSKYNLPLITADTTANDPAALCVFKRASTSMQDRVSRCDIDQIMNYYAIEVDQYNREPADFLFVTVFTTQNNLMDALESEINIFWQNRLKDNEKFTKYAVFHKSEEGSSIDLTESENATRMVSIHASKGDGRNVVFVIGITEQSLNKFCSNEPAEHRSLVYDSLLHVAFTRMKQKLYIRVNCNNDELCKRLQKHGNFTLGHDRISNKTQIRQLTSRVSTTACKIVKPLYDLLTTNEDKNAIIDMRHHNIRYYIMIINFLLTVMPTDSKYQIKAVMIKLSRAHIRRHASKQYNDDTSQGDKTINNEPHIIKLLQIDQTSRHTDYTKYLEIIHNTCLTVQSKIKSWLQNGEIHLCPYENVIFYYMYNRSHNWKAFDISMMDLYNITDKYSKFYLNPNDHVHCKCKDFNICHEFVGKEYFLKNHYDIMAKYNIGLMDYLKNKQLNFLTFHSAKIGTESTCILRTTFICVAYNTSTVYMFYFKPQFTEMNKYQVIWNSLFDALIIMLQHDKRDKEGNYERFAGRKVVASIVSLDEIREINWSNELHTTRLIFIDYIARLLIDKYKQIADHIVDYYITQATNREDTELIWYEYEKSYADDDQKNIPRFVESSFRDFVFRGGLSSVLCRNILHENITTHVNHFVKLLKSTIKT